MEKLTSKILRSRSDFSKKYHLNCISSDLTEDVLNQLSTFTDTQKKGPLFGKTIAIKDNLNLNGTTTTCASKILEGHISIYTATAVQKIIDAGGSIVAKTNMDEFAMGSSNEHSVYGPVRNPYNNDHVPGGSSGGSAVAVAAELVDMALGSDTGGSVRQPAAFCGLYGLKPTYGRVSRYGLTAFASSFDQVGVFAKSVDDTVTLFEAIAGHDEEDATSADETITAFEYNETDIRAFKIGIPTESMVEGLDLEISSTYQTMIDQLKEDGFLVEEISLPNTEHAIATYYILTTAEASSNLSRFDGIRYGYSKRGSDLAALYQNSRSEGFGDEVKRRIMLGNFVLSSGYYDAYYTKAQKVRRLIRDDYVNAFTQVDVLLTPTSPVLPFKIGEKIDDPLQMYLADIYTVPMSLAGIPAMNIPAGKSKSGLPIGLQLTSSYFKENILFGLAKYLEQ